MGTPTYVVSTSRKPTGELSIAARQWAQRLGVPFVPRRDRSLKAICHDEGVEGVLTVTAQRVALMLPHEGAAVAVGSGARSATPGLQYFFHPNMARTRIHNIQDGRGDPMVIAMSLQPGDEVLDCTLGRACDAIVASWVVGERGRIVGIEVSPLVAELTIDGLKTCEVSGPGLIEAMRRIQARQGDHEEVLSSLSEEAFDVVYFDPFFEETLERSRAMAPLRVVGEHRKLSAAALSEARRVAGRCVVIKQRREGPLRDLQGIQRIEAGAGSRIEYVVVAPTSH